MGKIFEFFLLLFLRMAFWLRYRVTVKGLEELSSEVLKKSGGVLFLPNHQAVLVDPVLVSMAVWKKFPIRPLIVEYMYFLPGVYRIMKFLNALPIPDFETSTNTLKRKRNERVLTEVIKGIKKGENFLLYPAGRLKHTCIEKVGGASATHRIISESPEVNVVLVRLKGLWGSSFSRALTGKVPPLFTALWNGVKIVLKNLIFFTPRREVIIEFYPAPADFPYDARRRDLNRWLENWYNQPDGLSKQEGELPGDSLQLVSYSFWKEDLPEVYQPKEFEEVKEVKITDIDPDVQEKIIAKLRELTELSANQISPEMSLSSDLGLDSLDTSELATYIQDQFDIKSVPAPELTTVSRVMAIAAKKVKIKEKAVEQVRDLSQWVYEGARFKTQIAHGDTIPEVFLHNCERMGHAAAIADARSGILKYPRLKLAVILFAEHIRNLPGKYIGIMLPASVGAYLTVLAVQMAGKIPLMVNWTIGPRHLKAVRELSNVEVVLTSWAFLERLDTADLTGVDDIFVMLESIRREFSIFDKIRALFHSKRSAKSIMKHFGIDKIKKEDTGVLLFTSGTESLPKGVPLSHENILANMRGGLESIDLYSDDVILGILPPFHAYGFTTCGLLGPLSGMRSAYFPDPTDGAGVAKAFETWKTTVMSGAPTFIKTMLKSASPEQLKTMRLCVTGAEAAPPELFQLMGQIGKEQCLLEGYGITECSPILTANRSGKPRKGVGSPVANVEICIVHLETNEVLPPDTEGLILARGPNVFSGYLNPGLASPFMTVEGKEWYNTGDIGLIDEQNRLTISGRKKRFVKVAAEMVSLLAIESTLLHAASDKGWQVREEGPTLAILAKEHPGARPTIKLVTTFDTSVDEINQAVREGGFSNLIRIAKVIKMEEIPIMGTGKINYRLLEEEYLTEK